MRELSQLDSKYAAVPLKLRLPKQWVPWKKVPRGDGTFGKAPCSPSGYLMSGAAPDPKNWLTFEDAVKAELTCDKIAGIGFVVTAPFFCADFDHCYHDGQLDPWVKEMFAQLPPPFYAELGPSGDGFHLWYELEGDHSQLPPNVGDKASGCEVFSHGKFYTMTGCAVPLEGM
jgi:putative DNA primase/helicase